MTVATIGEMIVTGTTVTKKTDTAVIAPGLPVALNTTNVVQSGLRPPGGRLMIKGLQGTMITGAEAMMTAEPLIIILTAAGTIRTDAETTEDATKKTNALMRGLGTQMEKGGRVEWYLFRWPREEETDSRRAYWFISLILDSDLCGVVVYTDRVLLKVNRWSTSPKTRKEHLHLSHFEAHLGDCATVSKANGLSSWLVSSFWLDVTYIFLKNCQQWPVTHSLRQDRKRIQFYWPSSCRSIMVCSLSANV